MITTRAFNRAVAATALAAGLSGCGLFPLPGDDTEVKTPKQASDELIKELTTIANEIIPGGRAIHLVDEPSHPCGGANGTTEEKIFADISVGSRNRDLTATTEEVMAVARQALTKRGWNPKENEGLKNPELVFQDGKGAGGSLTYAPNEKALTIRAHTACLPNPDF